MHKPDSPQQLAIDLLDRSVCSIQVASVLSDRHGIFSWGWNSSGLDGFGWHAEEFAISRANRKRLAGSTVTTIGRRQRTGRYVFSAPCEVCLGVIRAVGIGKIEFMGRSGWETFSYE